MPPKQHKILYPQNKNKSNNKENYFSTQNLYFKEINNIQNQINNGDNDEKILKSINNILNKMKILKSPESYNTYLFVKNMLLYFDNKKLCNINIKNIIKQETYLQDNIVFINENIEINQNIKINNDYINYIKTYGLPEHGIFLPSKLFLLKK